MQHTFNPQLIKSHFLGAPQFIRDKQTDRPLGRTLLGGVVSGCFGEESERRGEIVHLWDNFLGARYNCVPANLCALSPSRGRQTFEMSRIQVLFGVAVPLMTLSGIAVALRLVTPLRSYISWNAADLAWWKCRFYCRRFIVRRVGPDDWVMLVALVCFFDFLVLLGCY